MIMTGRQTSKTWPVWISDIYKQFINLDISFTRMIESLLGISVGTLTVQLDGQQWPMMPSIFRWIYENVRISVEIFSTENKMFFCF